MVTSRLADPARPGPRARSDARPCPSTSSKRGSSDLGHRPPPGVEQGQLRVDLAEVEVPLARPRRRRAVAQRRRSGPRGRRCGSSSEHGLPCAFSSSACSEVGGGEELAGHVARRRRLSSRATRNGRSVNLLDVVGEERRLPVDEELLEDHVAHRHRQGAVGTGVRRPATRRRTWRCRRSPGTTTTTFWPRYRASAIQCASGVRVTGTLEPHIIRYAGVPPVAGLRDVGLVAEHLRRGDGKVGVPVVERRASSRR